jgi:nucleotide-binding universal stress UspA family protein
MQKELLLAISDDRAASYNLRFIKEVFSRFCELKLTLFYVTPRNAAWIMDEKTFVPRGEGFDELVRHTKAKGERALLDAEKWIIDVAGCSGENVTTKVVHSKRGTVRELIDEARDGLYDALVLGRRGFSWFEGVFANSVCHEMLLSDIDFPIWISKRPPASPRHDVLLPVDGSDPSLRMVDHAGYMLADEDSHTFTLFHVAKDGHSMNQSSDIFDKGLSILGESGIEEERVELKMVNNKSVVKAILKEAQDGNYSAVGVGRHGVETNGRARGLFPSSVTVNLLRQLEDTALWISK